MRVRDLAERTGHTLWVGFVLVMLGVAVLGIVVIAVQDLVVGQPEPAPIVALYEEDGVAFAVLSTCDGDPPIGFILNVGDSAVWAVTPSPGAPPAPTIRLFEVPPGWTTTSLYGELPDDPRLEPDGEYEIWVRTTDGETAWTFRTDQLAETSANTVLGASADETAAHMSLAEFQRQAVDYCERRRARAAHTA